MVLGKNLSPNSEVSRMIIICTYPKKSSKSSLRRTYAISDYYNNVATLLKFYITITGIIMPSLKSIGQF